MTIDVTQMSVNELVSAVDSGFDRNWPWDSVGPDAVAALGELQRRVKASDYEAVAASLDDLFPDEDDDA